MAIQPLAPPLGPLLGASFDRAFTIMTRNWMLLAGVVFVALVAGAVNYLAAAALVFCFLIYWYFTSLANTVRLANPAYRMTAGTAMRLLGLSIVYGLAVDLGLLLLIVPGIYIANKWSLAPLILAKEDADMSTAMSRSWAVTDQFFWPTLGFNILAALAMFAVVIVGYVLAVGVGAGLFAVSSAGQAPAAYAPGSATLGGMFGVVIALVYCIYVMVLAYTYQAKDVALLNWYDGLKGALARVTLPPG